jgi:hypothetical protein
MDIHLDRDLVESILLIMDRARDAALREGETPDIGTHAVFLLKIRGIWPDLYTRFCYLEHA